MPIAAQSFAKIVITSARNLVEPHACLFTGELKGPTDFSEPIDSETFVKLTTRRNCYRPVIHAHVPLLFLLFSLDIPKDTGLTVTSTEARQDLARFSSTVFFFFNLSTINSSDCAAIDTRNQKSTPSGGQVARSLSESRMSLKAVRVFFFAFSP